MDTADQKIVQQVTLNWSEECEADDLEFYTLFILKTA